MSLAVVKSEMSIPKLFVASKSHFAAVMDDIPLALDDNQTALFIGPIIVLIALIHNSVLFTYHLYRFIKSKKKPKLHRLSLFCMIVTLLFLLVVFLTEYTWAFPPPPHPALDPFSYIPCAWRMRIASFSWCIFKFTYYAFFMERLFLIFRGAPELEFQPNHIRCARIGLFLFWFGQQGLVLFIGQNYNGMDNNGVCTEDFEPWILCLVLAGDFSIANSISIIFARRLIAFDIQTTETQMTETNHTTNPPKAPSTSIQIATKSTILGVVAMTTTQMSLVGIAITKIAHLFLPLDAMINWFVLLCICFVISVMITGY